MVGIPGKSKGCGTCRTRKVRCDLQKPTCGNCRRSERHCQGYDRYPVFLNRTAAGLQRRPRLEEVKRQSPDSISIAQRHPPDQTPQSDDPIAFSSPSKHILVRQMDFLNWFNENFAKAYIKLRVPLLMSKLLSIPNPGHLLQSSLIAISIMHFGSAAHDDSVMYEGRKFYVQALRHLQRALEFTSSSKTEDTLTCATVLGLYEILHGPKTGSRSSWRAHIDGIQALLLHRGWQALQTPVAQDIFEHCRGVIMLRNLLEGETSPFAQPEWLVGPWSNGKAKSYQQELCDYGFRLSALLDQSKNFNVSNFTSITELQAFLVKVSNLSQDVEAQHTGCTCQSSGSIEISSPRPLRASPPAGSSEVINPDLTLGQCAFSIALRLACQRLRKDARDQIFRLSETASIPTSNIFVPSDTELRRECILIDAEDAAVNLTLIRDLVRLIAVIQMKNLDPGSIMRLTWSLKQAIAVSGEQEPISSHCQRLIADLAALPLPTAKVLETRRSSSNDIGFGERFITSV